MTSTDFLNAYTVTSRYVLQKRKESLRRLVRIIKYNTYDQDIIRLLNKINSLEGLNAKVRYKGDTVLVRMVLEKLGIPEDVQHVIVTENRFLNRRFVNEKQNLIKDLAGNPYIRGTEKELFLGLVCGHAKLKIKKVFCIE